VKALDKRSFPVDTRAIELSIIRYGIIYSEVNISWGVLVDAVLGTLIAEGVCLGWCGRIIAARTQPRQGGREGIAPRVGVYLAQALQ